jgi:hypothetical protein
VLRGSLSTLIGEVHERPSHEPEMPKNPEHVTNVVLAHIYLPRHRLDRQETTGCAAYSGKPVSS